MESLVGRIRGGGKAMRGFMGLAAPGNVQIIVLLINEQSHRSRHWIFASSFLGHRSFVNGLGYSEKLHYKEGFGIWIIAGLDGGLKILWKGRNIKRNEGSSQSG